MPERSRLARRSALRRLGLVAFEEVPLEHLARQNGLDIRDAAEVAARYVELTSCYKLGRAGVDTRFLVMMAIGDE